MRRLLLVSLMLTASTASTAFAQATDFTGEWFGTASGPLACPSGGSATATFTVYMEFAQSDTTIFGAAVLIGPNDACVAGSPIISIGPFSGSGTVSGSSFSITSNNQGVSGTFSGTLTGPDTMNVSFSGDNGFALSGTATRGTAVGDISGSYGGTMTGSKDYSDRSCPSGDTVTFSGPGSATLQQSGMDLTGTITWSGEKELGEPGGCTLVDVPVVNASLSAVISAFTFTGTVTASEGSAPVTGLILGDAITIIVTLDRGTVVLSLTKGGSGGPSGNAISFSATPPTIRAGQSATLTWSAGGATSVVIDNGVGAVAASGSKSVSPSTTTTYTLTAMQGSSSKTATTTVTVLTGPIVNVTSFPSAMLEPANVGGASTTYAVTNSGSAPANVTLTQDGDFFTQSPSSFTLAAGATQVITIMASAEPAGSYDGASIVNGSTRVPVHLLAAAPPSGSVTAVAPQPRVDVSAPPDSSPGGSVSFQNTGNATLTGILTSDVPWIIPQSGIVTIAPGATGTFDFTIDRSKRPDSSSPIGSVEGNLALTFFTGTGSSFAKHTLDGTSPTPSVTIVKVVDTAKPAVTTAGIPALAAGEVALFIPGVGHVTGTGGTQFASDVNFLNPQGAKAINDLKLYYTSTSGNPAAAQTAALGSVPSQTSVAVGDVVKSVFSGTNEVGTLQVRSADASSLAVSAKVLTTNNPAGTFGNTIPTFRSDRSAAAGSALVLNGLRKDSSTHTNLYIQETAGSDATVQIDYLGADGATVASQSEAISAFKLLQLVNDVPQNAVAAVITNNSTGGGKVAAYATPVDEASNDTWSIPDWSQQLGYAATEATVIPVAGSVHGANGTFYRTDVAITNRGTAQASATLRYVSRTGTRIDKQVTLGAKQTDVISDVVGSFFGVSGDTTGFITFAPVSGSFAISSRTYTTSGSSSATFGSGVPVLALSSAVHDGGSKPIAGLADSTRSTVVAARPATYRTNFALEETTGQPATVRVTFRFTFPAGDKAQGVGSASRDYPLNGYQFLMLNSIAGEILGPARLQFGDLSNVEADFQVIDGNGAVMLFTSTVDNATGDSVLRTE